jgi:hypothetical protein
MDLVYIRHKPLGIWVLDWPVFVPPLDQVLVASEDEAYVLAERWSTDLTLLNRSKEFEALVWIPREILPTVKWAGEYLNLV